MRAGRLTPHSEEMVRQPSKIGDRRKNKVVLRSEKNEPRKWFSSVDVTIRNDLGEYSKV